MNTDIATATDTNTDLDQEVTSAPPAQPDAAPIPAPATGSKLTLDQIVERDGYLRNINDGHVDVLVESISTKGLEQPLVVLKDSNELVAGRHRYRALIRMSERNPDRFLAIFPGGKVSVQVFDLGDNPSQEDVLALELTENSVRQDYSDAEIVAAHETLRRMGYNAKPGRPRKNARKIGPVIQQMFGISESTVNRALGSVRRREKLGRDGVTGDGQGTRVSPARTRKTAASPADDGEQEAVVTVAHGSTFVESEDYAAACIAVLKLNNEEHRQLSNFLLGIIGRFGK